jgi:hypothetical protein
MMTDLVLLEEDKLPQSESAKLLTNSTGLCQNLSKAGRNGTSG